MKLERWEVIEYPMCLVHGREASRLHEPHGSASQWTCRKSCGIGTDEVLPKGDVRREIVPGNRKVVGEKAGILSHGHGARKQCVDLVTQVWEVTQKVASLTKERLEDGDSDNTPWNAEETKLQRSLTVRIGYMSHDLCDLQGGFRERRFMMLKLEGRQDGSRWAAIAKAESSCRTLYVSRRRSLGLHSQPHIDDRVVIMCALIDLSVAETTVYGLTIAASESLREGSYLELN